MLVWGVLVSPCPLAVPGRGRGPQTHRTQGAAPAWGRAAGRLCGVTEGWRGSAGRGKQGLQWLARSLISEALSSSRNDGELAIKESWKALSMLTRLSGAVKEEIWMSVCQGKIRTSHMLGGHLLLSEAQELGR